MDAGTFRFRVGEFECISTGDGALNYPPETLFANVTSEQVEEALRERGLPVDQVTTPYTCLFIDTGEHRVLVDTGAGDLGAHADQVFPGLDHSTSVTGLLPENLRTAGVEPSEVDTVIITHAHPDHVGGVPRTAATTAPTAPHRAIPSEFILPAPFTSPFSKNSKWHPFPEASSDFHNLPGNFFPTYS